MFHIEEGFDILRQLHLGPTVSREKTKKNTFARKRRSPESKVIEISENMLFFLTNVMTLYP